MKNITIDDYISDSGVFDMSILNEMYPDIIDKPIDINFKISDVRYKNYNITLLGYNLNMFSGLSGLDVLSNIDRMTIENTSNLKDLNLCKNVKSINCGVSITKNRDLISICGLDSATSSFNLTISNNPKLNNIDIFNKLKHITLDIYIIKNGINNINSFNKLKSVGSSIKISSNMELYELEGFNELEAVLNNITIISNPKLKSIRGFNNLTYVSNLNFSKNDNLTEIIGFDMLKSNFLCDIHLPYNEKFIVMSFPHLTKYDKCNLYYQNTYYNDLPEFNESDEMFEQFKDVFNVKLHSKQVVKQIIENYLGSSHFNGVLHHIIDSGGYDLIPWEILNTYDSNTIKRNNKIIRNALILT